MNHKLIIQPNLFEFEWDIITEEDNSKFIDELIKNEIPFKIKNVRLINKEFFLDGYHNLHGNFTQNFIRNLISPELEQISENNIKKDKKLNIRVSASLDKSFSGDAINHSQIEMSLDEYFKYIGDITLYMTQINLLELHSSEKLKEIISYSNLENLIDEKFLRINIWHSFKETLSKFHYDSYENFLYVIKGIKTVLLAPNNSKFIKSFPIGENSGNQCQRIKYKRSNDEIQKMKIDYLSKQYPKDYSFIQDYKKDFFKISKYFILKCTIIENEILYIPEGWWHQVETFGNDNLALNFWWDKSNKILRPGKETFLIKQAMMSLVENKILKIYHKKKLQFKKNSLIHMKKLIESRKDKILVYEIFKEEEKEENNLYKWIIIYSEFEKFKKLEAVSSKIDEIKLFFEKFWGILGEYNSISIFMDKINEMKSKVKDLILEEFKKSL
jgi:hypothetical protein